MADGVTVDTITKNVGEKVELSEFPPIPPKDGYTGKWKATEAITTTTTVEAEYIIDPDAPVYNVVAGTTELSKGNKAAGETLFPEGTWNDTTFTGMFPLAVTLENTSDGSSGLIYIKYDKTKVTPMAVVYNDDGDFESWKVADETDRTVFNESAHSKPLKISRLSSQGADPNAGYVYMVWNGAEGSVDANAVIANGKAAELGCFTFKTNDGVTVGDFDENTFALGTDIDADTIYAQAGSRSPLSLVANDSNVYGITEEAMTRLPMTVKFTYPNSTPKPVEKFTVTFLNEDGTTYETKTLNVGDTLAVKDFPKVPEKAGFTGEWDVKTDITTTTTVHAVYTPISTGDAKLNKIFTDGFKVADFNADTKEYKDIKASVGYNDYVIAGYADEGVKIEYSIDNGAFESANKENAFYFDLERGKITLVKIKLTNAAGEETIYSFEIVLPAAEVSYFETSGFEIEGFTPETKEYTVTPDSSEKYMRLWGKGPVDDDGIRFEYAQGDATKAPETMEYAKLAVNCDARENEYFEGTPNFDMNWSEKGFVNLWTEEGLSGKAMFIKVISEGAPDSYYVIKFQ